MQKNKEDAVITPMKFQCASSFGASLLASVCLLSSCGGGSNGPSAPKPTATSNAPTPTPGLPTPTPTPTTGPTSLHGQIGFVSTRDGNPNIYLMDAQGANQRAFAAANSSNEERSPSIARDGNTVVWSSNRPNKSATPNFEIYIQKSDGKGGQPVATYTNDEGNFPPDDTEPVISPDGTKIAWTTTRDGSKNIAVMNITGSGQTVLTAANGDEDSQPAWTSDSRSIAFYAVRGNARGVYLMNADGSNQRALLTSNASDAVRYFAPAYSPNGQLLAVAAESGGATTVSLRNPDGSPASTQFNASNALDVRTNPGFNLDGTRLIYTASNGGVGQQIYTSNLDGSSERALTAAGTNFEAMFSN